MDFIHLAALVANTTNGERIIHKNVDSNCCSVKFSQQRSGCEGVVVRVHRPVCVWHIVHNLSFEIFRNDARY